MEQEIGREEYNLRSDYMEMMIQFGYVTMFAAVLPIAPALAMVNNKMEIKVDFLKLSGCRRPDIIDRSTLQGWMTCLTVLSYASVFTNSFLLCIASKNLGSIVPKDYISYIETDIQRFSEFSFIFYYARFALLVLVEHALLGLKVVLSHLIEDLPRWVQEKRAQEAQRLRKQTTKDRLQTYKLIIFGSSVTVF